ncbi:hypothetical protein JXQ31_08235 [candidate division KSB1 bacterium]|nr:hypothetical protein [candidate division KSB1 bacterium]
MKQKFKLFLYSRRVIFPVLLYFVIIVGKSFACNVPVFRYALERWPADFFVLQIYYDQSFDADSEKLLNQLLKRTQDDSLINLTLKILNVSDSATKSFPQYPWMELYFPETTGIRGVIWSGPFTEDNIRRLITSPARSALAERLTAGEAAVWLFLESGDNEKDRAAEALLVEYLKKLSNELKIPETGFDINGNLIRVEDFHDYDVHFSMIRLSRENPQEEIFVSMLLGSEEDLVYYNEPIAFPVFGRGRALYGLIGAGLNGKTISHACQSVIGWCSCEVKALNPGVDLLLENDWSNPAGGKMVKNEELPPLTGVSAFIENDTLKEKTKSEQNIGEQKPDTLLLSDSVRTPEITSTPPDDNSLESGNKKITRPLIRNIILVFVFGLIFMTGLTLFLLQKRRKQ